MYHFEPRSAFKRIDRDRNYSLNAYEISDFLKDNDIYMSTTDIGYLIAAYDSDKDNRLDFKEFERLVLTGDHTLKMRTYGRPEPYIGYRDRLSYNVEYELSRLLKLEVERLTDLAQERTQIKARYDYSRLDAFKSIDKYKV